MCCCEDFRIIFVMMVEVSVSRRNCFDFVSYEEVKKFVDEVVWKFYELEIFGVIVLDDVKYWVFE